MSHRAKTGGKPIKTRRRKTMGLKQRNAQKGLRHRDPLTVSMLVNPNQIL
jgi:hypothetical protein